MIHAMTEENEMLVWMNLAAVRETFAFLGHGFLGQIQYWDAYKHGGMHRMINGRQEKKTKIALMN